MSREDIVTPTKQGQLVKFHSPLPDEEPDQKYEVLEIIEDTDRPRVDIRPVNTGLNYPPINTVPLNDVTVVG